MKSKLEMKGQKGPCSKRTKHFAFCIYILPGTSFINVGGIGYELYESHGVPTFWDYDL